MYFTYLLAITSQKPSDVNKITDSLKTSTNVQLEILGASADDLFINLQKIANAQAAFNRKKRNETQKSFIFDENDESKTTKGK
jgi:hypothetical protein